MRPFASIINLNWTCEKNSTFKTQFNFIKSLFVNVNEFLPTKINVRREYKASTISNWATIDQN